MPRPRKIIFATLVRESLSTWKLLAAKLSTFFVLISFENIMKNVLFRILTVVKTRNKFLLTCDFLQIIENSLNWLNLDNLNCFLAFAKICRSKQNLFRVLTTVNMRKRTFFRIFSSYNNVLTANLWNWRISIIFYVMRVHSSWFRIFHFSGEMLSWCEEIRYLKLNVFFQILYFLIY